MSTWRWHDDNPSGPGQSESPSYRGQPPGSDDSFQPQEQDYESTGTDQAENLYGDSLTNTGSSFPEEEEDNGSTSIDQPENSNDNTVSDLQDQNDGSTQNVQTENSIDNNMSDLLDQNNGGTQTDQLDNSNDDNVSDLQDLNNGITQNDQTENLNNSNVSDLQDQNNGSNQIDQSENSNDNNVSDLQDQNTGSTQTDQLGNLNDNNLTTTVPGKQNPDTESTQTDQPGNLNDNTLTSTESNVQEQGNNEYNTTPPGETTTTTTDVPTSTASPAVNAVVKTPDDDIMIIQIVKPNDNGTADAVHEMLEGVDLKKGTKDFVTQFNRRYELLPEDEEDNNKWDKFSRAVVENFVLDFCNNYKVNTTQANATKSDDYDDDDEIMNYDEAFNLAILHLKEKKDMTAVQLAIPTRKIADIFESVLDTPVGIVQSRCQDYMKKWQCNAQYLARLTDESETCGSIWNHAKLHLKILMVIAQGTQSEQNNDPTEIVYEELRTSRRRSNNRRQRHYFKFIVRTLKRLRNRLQRSLTVQSQIFNELKKAQNSGELQCLKIDHVPRF